MFEAMERNRTAEQLHMPVSYREADVATGSLLTRRKAPGNRSGFADPNSLQNGRYCSAFARLRAYRP
jgi:hypothetical protein